MKMMILTLQGYGVNNPMFYIPPITPK